MSFRCTKLSLVLQVICLGLLVLSCFAKPVAHSWTNSTLVSRNKSRKTITSFFARQYTGDDCSEDDDCDGDRECVDSDSRRECDGGGCICAPEDEDDSECNDSDDCMQNDFCLAVPGEDGRCLSCNLKDTVEDLGGEAVDGGNCVCIAIDSLSQFDKSSLVFSTHRRASVFCDTHGNCATPGHMVVYRSNAMSMASYCGQEDVSCSRRVKLVNSPKMKIGLRVPSFSKDLEFTALAAARETKLEETVLKMAVFMGV